MEISGPAGGGKRFDPFAPVDGTAVAVFRTVFGALLAIQVARYFLNGWIDAQFHEPRHFFPWPGLEWIRPWPRPWMHVHFAVLGGLAAAMAAGVQPRASAFLFGLGFTYAWLIDRANYLNHYYLISLLCGILAAIPSGRTLPAWAVALLRFQVGAVYFFAGLAKLQGDWLLRGQPLRMWLAEVEGIPGLHAPGVAAALSVAAAAFDLSVPFFLRVRRTRAVAYGCAVVFHLATALLFPIGLFPWVMIAAGLVFFGGDLRPEGSCGRVPRSPAILAAAAAYALIQVLVPLRALRGDALWAEQGFRFSWRVMLIEKGAEARFWAEDVATGERLPVRVEDYLTPAQARQMRSQPDLLGAFARIVRLRFRGEGREVRVRGEVWVSLNGRPASLLVDPGADLARGGPADWVRPLQDGS
ncbi:MAG TPA: HTTM domain-containing protein [Planctomycetota bacterium]|nr:HTTM domain-containing protein [Planctomycetota bacterium]